jgi:hypothetical protein
LLDHIHSPTPARKAVVPCSSLGTAAYARSRDRGKVVLIMVELVLRADLLLLDDVETGMQRTLCSLSRLERRDRLLVCGSTDVAGGVAIHTPPSMPRVVEDLAESHSAALVASEEAMDGVTVLLLPQTTVVQRVGHVRRVGGSRERAFQVLGRYTIE